MYLFFWQNARYHNVPAEISTGEGRDEEENEEGEKEKRRIENS